MREEEVLNLSGKAWVPLPRLGRTVPYGYKVSDNDPEVLEPIIFELEALERAKEYRAKKHSYHKIAVWLSQVTGRSITAEGLRKRLEIDSQRRRKAQTLANWARKYKEALEAAKALDERLGNDTTVYKQALNELIQISTHND